MAEEVKTRVDNVHVCSFFNCSKSFKKRNRLLEHFRTHTGERPYQCTEPGCTKSYARAAHLQRHVHVSHPDSDEPEIQQTFQCTTEGCKQVFTNVYNLKRHIKRIHSNKQYKCTFSGCLKTFKKHKQLKTHLFEHTNIKPYVCSVDGCGKSFCLPSKLKRHEKTHEGFTCGIDGCTVKVMKWSLMMKHKTLEHFQHHKCTQCEKTFKQKSWLKCHMAVHEDTRNAFQCPRDGCDRVYFDERNLAAHIRSYHDGQQFCCVVEGCGRTLCSKTKLLQHAKLHDPNRPLPKKKSRKGQRKKTIAAVISGFDPKRMNGINDPVSQISSDEKITCSDNEEREVTLTTSTAATSSHVKFGENESIDVSLETQAENSSNQCIEPVLKSVQNGAETNITTSNSSDSIKLTSESFNDMEIQSILLSSNQKPAEKDIFSNEFDCVAISCNDGSILLKSFTSSNNNLEKGDNFVKNGCSASSLPIGLILGQSTTNLHNDD